MKKIFLFLFVINSIVINAQIGGNSTYEFLNVPVSARAGSLGGEIISTKDNDPNLSLNNPSLLSKEMNGMLTLTYLNYFADVNYGYVSYTKDFKRIGTFSTGIKYIDYGTFLETDESGNEFGEFKAAEYALVIGWSKNIDSLFSIGANLKPVYSNLYEYNSFGIALDLSGIYYNPKREISVAAVIKNIGYQIKPYVEDNNEPLPFEVQIGLSKKLKHVPVRLSVTGIQMQNWNLAFNDSINITNADTKLNDEEKNERNKTGFLTEAFRHMIFGVELIPSKNFSLRFGYNHKRRAELALENAPGLVGFSWGFGFRIKKFHISYGSASYHVAGSSNHFTLSTNLSEFYRKGATPQPSKEKKIKKKKSKKTKGKKNE